MDHIISILDFISSSWSHREITVVPRYTNLSNLSISSLPACSAPGSDFAQLVAMNYLVFLRLKFRPFIAQSFNEAH